jgi:phytanoyl-CoA hydroxylase
LQGSLDTVIVWIPFMDVNMTNFPVEFIPGSHLGGLYSGKILEYLYEIDQNCYNENDFIPGEMGFGDVLFMSSFLLHRTSLGNSTGLRIAGTIRYENASESTYVERVYPHAQKRFVNREFICPDFPQIEQVRAAFKLDSLHDFPLNYEPQK